MEPDRNAFPILSGREGYAEPFFHERNASRHADQIPLAFSVPVGLWRHPMRQALLLLTLFLAVACSHGRTASFPSAANPDMMGEVTVVRNDNLFGWGLSVKVTFNEVVIARLRAGEHVTFPAAPGLHTVGVAERGISVAVERHRRYYFLISPEDSPAGFEIERLDPGRGEEWVAKTKPVS
jgi:hypothetical protein